MSQRVRDIDESDSWSSLRSATVWMVINKIASEELLIKGDWAGGVGL